MTEGLLSLVSLVFLLFFFIILNLNNKIWLFVGFVLQVVLLESTDQFLHTRVQGFGRQSCYLTAIYGKCSRVERSSLWADICHLHLLVSPHDPWLLGGDYNVVADSREYFRRSQLAMGLVLGFRNLIDDCYLMKLPSIGGNYTWTGVRSQSRVWKKLDRILINPAWLSSYPLSSISVLSRTYFDHAPLLLEVELQAPIVSKPFRFHKFWLTRLNFRDIVRAN